MKWDDLRFVLEIARHATLSSAASSLGVTHTTVGRRLRALEDQLGVKLFEATSEGFVLTAAGQDVARVAERAEAEVVALEARVMGRDARLSGSLRISTMDVLFRRFAGAIRSFGERYPGIELTLHFTDDQASLPRRDADVALRLSNQPPEALVGRRIGRLSFAAYGERTLVAARGASADLGTYPWVSWHEQGMRRFLEGWLAEHAPGAQVSARVEATSLQLREVVAAGLGVHFLACFEGDADPRLTRIGPSMEAFEHDVWLLTLPELRHQGRVRAFMDHLYAAADAS